MFKVDYLNHRRCAIDKRAANINSNNNNSIGKGNKKSNKYALKSTEQAPTTGVRIQN